MLPIELISHLARILSLTIRLFANMFASDLLILIFFRIISHCAAGNISLGCIWAFL